MSSSEALKAEGGYPYSFFTQKKETLKKFECNKCNKVCKDIIELTCHDDDITIDINKLLYCKLCIQNILSNNNNKCPINNHSNCKYGISRVYAREIINLIVYCPNSKCNVSQEGFGDLNDINNNEQDVKTDDCSWSGKLLDLDKHLKQCKNIPVKCKYQSFGCDYQAKKSLMDNHQNNNMRSHLDLVMEENKRLKNANENLVNRVSKLENEMIKFREEFKKYEKKKTEELKSNDTWDVNSMDDGMTLQKNIVVKVAESGHRCVFGTKQFSSGKHYWKFKIHNMITNNWGNCTIGIALSSNVQNRRNKGFYGYGFAPVYAKQNNKNMCTTFKNHFSQHKDYGPICKNGDIIEMFVDMDNRSMRFNINNTSYGNAFNNGEIESGEYRMCIGMCTKDNKLELL